MSYTVKAEDALADLGGFDAIIDVRSPAEFAEDHLPGAQNWPVLDNEERRIVGTLYATSPFEARKLGAALVARNIARHIETHAASLGKTWRPLVYCWRGGQRSGAMNWFLGQIGFRARQLEGGYKAYRAAVRDALARLPAGLELHVLCGRTGSGKTRLLQALAEAGAQTLDLEALACHRGSVLGALPDAPQPSQKRFDSLLWQQLRALDPARPVFVESESRKVGQLRVPEALHAAMRASTHCVWIEMPDAARIELLLQDYGHFATDVEGFCGQLEGLIPLRGKEQVRQWQAQARAGQWAEVFGALMREHYDPGYERSLRGHYPHVEQALRLPLADGGAASLAAAARALV
ncbi:tRNA 2-selenouridine(34) synthase MnmH [Roseateles violae]|uniref:tRNA 2-selenouridine(34) synthase MnmH n=1 Tax=Roseateles violae TaxID=3058042 RepID=A0ABT8DV63_9BURK|nr:tRNA 2-selenouridine(34) synthase MnmH [Pelomonas sp. PFR6]MDN3920267.1 tRNA 2-selenouridine(34) synthase MnmH [Pelomonas sp. PFR6]